MTPNELAIGATDDDTGEASARSAEQSKVDELKIIQRMNDKNETKQNLSIESIKDDIKFIRAGSEFQEINSSSSLYSRPWCRYWLSETEDRIYYSSDTSEEGESSYLDIIKIDEIRYGWRTDDFLHISRAMRKAKGCQPMTEAKCFSIHFNYNSMSLQAEDDETAKRWVNALQFLTNMVQLDATRNRFSPSFWFRRYFREAVEIEKTGTFTYAKCKKLLDDLNVRLDETTIKSHFEEANTDKTRSKAMQVLTEEEFVEFFQLISQNKAVDNLYKELCGADSQLSTKKLKDFLVDVQGLMDVTEEQVEEMMKTYKAEQLSGFKSLLYSEMFDIRKEEHRRIHQNMTRPLSHYWIRSSHNTYLTSDQLVGRSSIEGYIRAQNSACIELDLHDGPDGEAIIRHGHTLTSMILARDVLEYAIRPYAFLKNDYPVILSIEDHLSDIQRRRFIHDFQEVFGEDVCLIDTDRLDQFPSLEELKRKIILKGSRSKYGKLANVCQTVHYKDNDRATIPCTVVSLSEPKINGVIKPNIRERVSSKTKPAEDRRERLRHRTTSQLVRVYPGWSRQWSSNFNPVHYMNYGCQMVAMNAQTVCEELVLYAGRFRSNGDSPYVLKPGFLLDPRAARVPPKRLVITVISAQKLPRSSTVRRRFPSHIFTGQGPYVKVTVEGVEADCQKKKTLRVSGDSLNPAWGSVMEFRITEPELAIVMFTLHHKDAMGSFALPVMSLGQGYRHVSLKDQYLSPVPLANLFVKIQLEDL